MATSCFGARDARPSTFHAGLPRHGGDWGARFWIVQRDPLPRTAPAKKMSAMPVWKFFGSRVCQDVRTEQRKEIGQATLTGPSAWHNGSKLSYHRHHLYRRRFAVGPFSNLCLSARSRCPDVCPLRYGSHNVLKLIEPQDGLERCAPVRQRPASESFQNAPGSLTVGTSSFGPGLQSHHAANTANPEGSRMNEGASS